MKWVVKTFEELSIHELYHILRLRSAVFVVEQQSIYLDPDGKDLQAIHLMLLQGCEKNDANKPCQANVCKGDREIHSGCMKDGSLLAYARLLPDEADEKKAWLGRIISVQRGCGYGRMLVGKGLELAKKQLHANSVWLEAQVQAQPFYEKMGFVQVGSTYWLDGILHVNMCKNLAETEM